MPGMPEIIGGYSQTYKRIKLAGLFGSIRPVGLEAFVFSEELVIDKVLTTEPISPQRSVLKRTVECELTIDPMQMRSIYQWLGQKIAEYERLFGKIPSLEELESRARGQTH
jgi:hypothetical protein